MLLPLPEGEITEGVARIRPQALEKTPPLHFLPFPGEERTVLPLARGSQSWSTESGSALQSKKRGVPAPMDPAGGSTGSLGDLQAAENVGRKASCKAPAAQRLRHTIQVGEGATTRQESRVAARSSPEGAVQGSTASHRRNAADGLRSSFQLSVKSR